MSIKICRTYLVFVLLRNLCVTQEYENKNFNTFAAEIKTTNQNKYL